MPGEDPDEPGAGERTGEATSPDGDGKPDTGDGSERRGRDSPKTTEPETTSPERGDRSRPQGDVPSREGTADAPPAPAGDTKRARDGRGEGQEAIGPVEMVKEVLTSVGMVLLIGVFLFAASGVWPPLVAVESGSMEPHMFRGDLVFVSEEGRYAPDTAVEGVVTYQQGRETGYKSFGTYGNVIVYQPNGEAGTPVIHRARFYVEEGENWVQRADPQYLGGDKTCAEIVTCPAPHAGYITRGDGNPQYDQVGRTRSGVLSTVVKPDWVRGNAKVRVPTLGCIRLELSGISCGPLIR